VAGVEIKEDKFVYSHHAKDAEYLKLCNAFDIIRMEDLISFLDEQTEAVTEYSEPLARRLIEKITVYDEKLVVEFKSGLTVEVEA